MMADQWLARPEQITQTQMFVWSWMLQIYFLIAGNIITSSSSEMQSLISNNRTQRQIEGLPAAVRASSSSTADTLFSGQKLEYERTRSSSDTMMTG